MAESGTNYATIPAGATWDSAKNHAVLNGQPITITGIKDEASFNEAKAKQAT